MKKKLACILLCLGMTNLFAGSVSKVVAFGDSLSDTGNLYEYMHRQLPMSPPYFKGRFTSGPVWVEHLVRHYYGDDALAHLAVYAFGGAGIDAEEEEDDINDGAMLTLNVQLESYLLAHQDKANSDALYTIWMGANNYLGIPDAPEKEVDLVISGIIGTAEKLVKKGAKNLMLIGLPDLGRTPMAAEFESQKELSYITNHHNAELIKGFKTLKAQYPDVTWVYFDVNALFIDILEHPEQYGYENVSGTCYDSVEYLPSSSQPILNMVSRVKPKLNASNGHDACEKYLFFDQVHPTGSAHRLFSQLATESLENAGVFFK